VFAYNVHHVAIAVHDLDAAVTRHIALFGGEPLYTEEVESQGVTEAMLPMGGSHIQLLAPLGPDTPVGRFLSKRGEGIHHVAYAVADIDAAIAHLLDQGVEMIDVKPRAGGGGHKVAFVHPRAFAGTLVELVEVAE
jgi:methylmalonyl-CoA epimerase